MLAGIVSNVCASVVGHRNNAAQSRLQSYPDPFLDLLVKQRHPDWSLDLFRGFDLSCFFYKYKDITKGVFEA